MSDDVIREQPGPYQVFMLGLCLYVLFVLGMTTLLTGGVVTTMVTRQPCSPVRPERLASLSYSRAAGDHAAHPNLGPTCQFTISTPSLRKIAGGRGFRSPGLLGGLSTACDGYQRAQDQDCHRQRKPLVAGVSVPFPVHARVFVEPAQGASVRAAAISLPWILGRTIPYLTLASPVSQAGQFGFDDRHRSILRDEGCLIG